MPAQHSGSAPVAHCTSFDIIKLPSSLRVEASGTTGSTPPSSWGIRLSGALRPSLGRGKGVERRGDAACSRLPSKEALATSPAADRMEGSVADLGSLDLEASEADLDLDSIAPLGGGLAAAGWALAASPRSSKMIAQLTSPSASRTRPGLMRNPENQNGACSLRKYQSLHIIHAACI